MTFPARPCISKPVSSPFHICDGLSARFFSTKKIKPGVSISRSLPVSFQEVVTFVILPEGFAKQKSETICPQVCSLEKGFFFHLCERMFWPCKVNTIETHRNSGLPLQSANLRTGFLRALLELEVGLCVCWSKPGHLSDLQEWSFNSQLFLLIFECLVLPP